MIILEAILGVGFGVATIAWARALGRWFGHRFERIELLAWVLATIALPLIYVGFALATPSDHGLRTELVGVVIFVPMALVAWRVERPWLVLALAWGSHAAWDVLLHSREATPYVVGWYPGVCLGTDLVVATYLFFRSRSGDADRRVDGSRVLVIRNNEIAATLTRPTSPGADGVDPCDRCARPFEEILITTGTAHGDPEVWDESPVAVDGWTCSTCQAVRYPRRLSAESSVRYGQAGVQAVQQRDWREAEWWFTRIAWAWPTYAPAYLDLAGALGERLASGFDTGLPARRRVERRQREAFDLALEAVEAGGDDHSALLRATVSLRAAEAAAAERSADRARRILDRLRERETLDEATAAREQEIRTFVDQERWIFVEASAVLKPYLLVSGRSASTIGPAVRADCVRAVEKLEAFYASNPGHWQSIWMAAMGRAALGEREATLTQWRRAWEAHPDCAEIIREASLAFLRVDMVDEALAINRDATVRLPGDATLWCNRAVCELLAGNLDEARHAVLESQRLDPNDEIAKNLSRKLAQLRQEGPFPKTLAELEGRAKG